MRHRPNLHCSQDLSLIHISNLRIDGDSYAPEGEQNFDNETKSLVYKVSAADDVDREYTCLLYTSVKL